MDTTKTRKIAYNENTRKWEVVYPEDEGYEGAIEQIWAARLNFWVTVPDDHQAICPRCGQKLGTLAPLAQARANSQNCTTCYIDINGRD